MNRVSQLSIFAIALALLTLALGAGWAVADTIVVPSSDVTMLAQDDESDEEGDEEDEDEDELACEDGVEKEEGDEEDEASFIVAGDDEEEEGDEDEDEDELA